MPSQGDSRQPIPKQPLAASGPTKYYFAYGSNLHLKQMKRRCPNSKYIGRGRLVNYRWQINERGYANIIKDEGYWVDGLVYEINSRDEAQLDINEGVSKNAYAKRHMRVYLYRAPGVLYRRPVSWIVDKGGPEKIMQQAGRTNRKQAEASQPWCPEVLVYISLNYLVDSEPKDEYVTRINLGIRDARALGIDQDYISTCIRPFIPIPSGAIDDTSLRASKPKPMAARRSNRDISAGEDGAPPRKDGQATNGFDGHKPQQPSTRRDLVAGDLVPASLPPPLPPRPAARYEVAPFIIVEEFRNCRTSARWG